MRREWQDQVDEADLETGLTFQYWRGMFDDRAPNIRDVLPARLPGRWIRGECGDEFKPNRHLIGIWEPLQTKAPNPARCQPYCCYARTVIFYHRPYIPTGPHPYHRRGRDWGWTEGGFAQFDQITTRIGGGDIVLFDGDRFQVGAGHVRWHRGRWWMRSWARRVERARWEEAA